MRHLGRARPGHLLRRIQVRGALPGPDARIPAMPERSPCRLPAPALRGRDRGIPAAGRTSSTRQSACRLTASHERSAWRTIRAATTEKSPLAQVTCCRFLTAARSGETMDDCWDGPSEKRHARMSPRQKRVNGKDRPVVRFPRLDSYDRSCYCQDMRADLSSKTNAEIGEPRHSKGQASLRRHFARRREVGNNEGIGRLVDRRLGRRGWDEQERPVCPLQVQRRTGIGDD